MAKEGRLPNGLQRRQFHHLLEYVANNFRTIPRNPELGELHKPIVPLAFFEATANNGSPIKALGFYVHSRYVPTTDWILTLAFDQQNNIVGFKSAHTRPFPANDTEAEYESHRIPPGSPMPDMTATGVVSTIRGGEGLGSITETMHAKTMKLYATATKHTVLYVISDDNAAQLADLEKTYGEPPTDDVREEASQQRARWETLFKGQSEQFYSPGEDLELPQGYKLPQGSHDLQSLNSQTTRQEFDANGLNFSVDTLNGLIQRAYQELRA